MPSNKKDGIDQIEISQKSSPWQTINIFLSRYFKYLSIIIALLAVTGAYFYLLRPKYNEIIVEINNTKNAQETERDDLNRYYNKLVAYIAEYEKIKKADIKKIGQLAPKDSNYEKLFTDFETIIKEQGFILNSLSISPDNGKSSTNKTTASAKAVSDSSDQAGIGKIKISADISGVDYASLKHLLAVIENNLRLMDVESLNWSPDKAGVNLEIITYYLK